MPFSSRVRLFSLERERESEGDSNRERESEGESNRERESEGESNRERKSEGESNRERWKRHGESDTFVVFRLKLCSFTSASMLVFRFIGYFSRSRNYQNIQK